MLLYLYLTSSESRARATELKTDQQKTVHFPWRYVVLAYLLAWIFWIPVILTRQDYQSSSLLIAIVLLGVFGPGIAGIVLTYVDGGKAAGRDFWQRVFDYKRIEPLWYLAIFAIWPLINLLAVGINLLLGGEPPDFTFLRENATQPLGLVVVLLLYLIQAGLEELGWRGYMLDRMQIYWRPLWAALVVGIVHAFWHLPLFWMEGTNQKAYGFGINFIVFVLVVLASSIYETWIYNKNYRSTLAAILLHWWGNFKPGCFNVPGTGQLRIYQGIMIAGAIVVAVVWLGKNKAPNFRNKTVS